MSLKLRDNGLDFTHLALHNYDTSKVVDSDAPWMLENTRAKLTDKPTLAVVDVHLQYRVQYNIDNINLTPLGVKRTPSGTFVLCVILK